NACNWKIQARTAVPIANFASVCEVGVGNPRKIRCTSSTHAASSPSPTTSEKLKRPRFSQSRIGPKRRGIIARSKVDSLLDDVARAAADLIEGAPEIFAEHA